MGSLVDIRHGTESENSAGAASLVMSITGKVTCVIDAGARLSHSKRM